MKNRSETTIQNRYKVFNLLLDLPYCCVYQMIGLTDNQSYLLIDYDPTRDPNSLKDEMDLWMEIGKDPFPSLTESWKTGQVYSLVLPPLETDTLEDFQVVNRIHLVGEAILDVVPELIAVFEELHSLQLSIFRSEDMPRRFYASSEGKFRILPSILHRLFHREVPVPESFGKSGKEAPVSEYTRVLGELLFYCTTGTYLVGKEAANGLRQTVSPPAAGFLDFLILGRAHSFQSVSEKYVEFKRHKEKFQKNERAKRNRRGLPKRAASPSRMVFSSIVWVVSYYGNLIVKTGLAGVRFLRWLRTFRWEGVKSVLAKDAKRVREKFRSVVSGSWTWSGPSDADILYFTKYLAILTHAGVPLARSLDILQQQSPHPELKKAVKTILYEVSERGSSISQGMAASPRIFSDIYVNMVSTGELSGEVNEGLNRIANYLEFGLRIKRKIKSATIYPLVIGLASFGFFLFFVYVILPNFMAIFQQLNMKLPLPTRILVALASFAHAPLVILETLGGIFLLTLPFRAFLNTVPGRKEADVVKLSLPLFGPLYKKVLLARFASTLGSLLESGVPLVGALESTGKAAGNQIVQELSMLISQEARAGTSLYVSFSRPGFFPNFFVSMLKVGEETGESARMLYKIRDFYEEEVSVSLERLGSIIEPLLMGIMGLIVGFVVMAVFLPVYQTISILH